MIGDGPLVASAVLGPAVASVAWLVLSRWPAARRTAGGTAAGLAHAAAWVLTARLYRGDAPEWRGLSPGLLEATILVVVELGVMLVALRTERLRPGQATAVFVALGAATSAVAYGSFSSSLAVMGLALPVPTLAVISAGLVEGRTGLRGALGLIAADLVGLVGLSFLVADAGSSLAGPVSSPGVGLLLAAAALKAGAIPGVATWALTASGPGGGVLGTVLRGQGMALAAVACLQASRAPQHLGVAALGAAAVLAAGGAALLARRSWDAAAAVAGAAAGVPLLAAGMGGAVGARAFLLLFPAFLLASALLVSLVPSDPPAPGSRTGGWAGPPALAVAAASLAAVPPAAAFPGAWLVLELASARAATDPSWLLLAGSAAAGLGLAGVASVPLIRAARPRTGLTVAAVALSGFLLYMGAAPVRLTLGWLVRVERAVGLPEILPTAGAPDLPALPEGALVPAMAAGAVVAMALLVLGRGVRAQDAGFEPTVVLRLPAPVAGAAAAGRRAVDRLPVLVAALGLAGAGVLALLIRLVAQAAGQGFL